MSSTINALTSGGGIAIAGDTSGQLQLQTNNGTTAVTISTSQNVGIGNTSPTRKLDIYGGASGTRTDVYVANAAGDYGCGVLTDNNGYVSSSNSTLFYTNATERMRISSVGTVGIGTSASDSAVRCFIYGGNTTSGTYALIVRNSSASDCLVIRNDAGVQFPGVVSTFTTGAGANAVVDGATGLIQRSTSSLKYKTNIQDATYGLADVLKLRPVTYQGKSELDGNKVFGGLIAEEVNEAGLNQFVVYDKDGSPDSLAYGNMVSLCIKAIQELNAKVTALEAQLGAK
jgi:hypothetical protein